MDRFLNIGLLSNPLNWVTVLLMCAFALLLLSIVSPEQQPSS